jgi:hypothetical protein
MGARLALNLKWVIMHIVYVTMADFGSFVQNLSETNLNFKHQQVRYQKK